MAREANRLASDLRDVLTSPLGPSGAAAVPSDANGDGGKPDNQAKAAAVRKQAAALREQAAQLFAQAAAAAARESPARRAASAATHEAKVAAEEEVEDA